VRKIEKATLEKGRQPIQAFPVINCRVIFVTLWPTGHTHASKLDTQSNANRFHLFVSKAKTYILIEVMEIIDQIAFALHQKVRLPLE
jgi:hypothetical protein